MNNLAISSDKGLNPALAGELSALRGNMVSAAEQTPMPERFTAVPDADRPAMVITDTETGRSSSVALCNYKGVRRALTDLLG